MYYHEKRYTPDSPRRGHAGDLPSDGGLAAQRPNPRRHPTSPASPCSKALA